MPTRPPSALLVLQRMADENRDVRSASLSTNPIDVQLRGGNGEVTIGVDARTAQELIAGKRLVGALYIADAKQYAEEEEALKGNGVEE